MEQIENVKKRLKKENISIRELSEITNLSEATLYRYFEGTKCSKKTRLIMDEFIEFAGTYKSVEEMVNIGQVRIPQSHYDYLKRHAEESDISVAEVLRRVIENVVDNDYLWKSFEEQLNITERALKTTMSNTMIPFFKQQDKEIAFVGNQVMYIEELLLRLFDKNSKDFREQLVPVKERMFEIGDDRRYKRKKHTD